MFSDNAVLNDTPQLMPHNYCTCSLIQIWHTTNYNFSKYLIKKKIRTWISRFVLCYRVH